MDFLCLGANQNLYDGSDTYFPNGQILNTNVMRTFLKQLLTPVSNGPEITQLLLDTIDVKVSMTTINTEVEGHPDFPGLLSISDTLTRFGVENISARFDFEQLKELPVPFVIQVKSRDKASSYFSLVRKIDEQQVQFFDPETHQWISGTPSLLNERYTGITLMAEATEGAGESNYRENARKENREGRLKILKLLLMPSVILLAAVEAFLNIGSNVLMPFVFTLLTLIGAVIGGLLCWYELDQYNPLLQQICTAGKKTDCGAILSSKASKIGGISWSVIGLSYFMSSLLFLLFSGIAVPQTLFVVAWLNVLALPYILFSVYYQWRVAKHWCVLCLSVQTVLVLQFVVAFSAGWHLLSNWNAIRIDSLLAPFALCYLLPFVIIDQLLSSYRDVKNGRGHMGELMRIKHNPEIFSALLSRQKMVSENTEGLGIILGNPNARVKIVKVCNPYCGPCAKAHVPVEALLHQYQDIRVQMIFAVSNNENDHRSMPVKHFLAMAQKGDEQLIKKVLDDWYLAAEKVYEPFAEKYQLNGELKQQDEKVEAMKEWCDKVDVTFTPTFFISLPNEDGSASAYYQLPETYNIEDLRYFLEN